MQKLIIVAVLTTLAWSTTLHAQIQINADPHVREIGETVDRILLGSEWNSAPEYYGYRCQIFIAEAWTTNMAGDRTYTAFHEVRDDNTIYYTYPHFYWSAGLDIFDGGATRTVRADQPTVDCGNGAIHVFPHFHLDGKYYVVAKWSSWNWVLQRWEVAHYASKEVQVPIMQGPPTPPTGSGGTGGGINN